MTGLLIKDYYTLKKNTRFILLMIVLFALIPLGDLNRFVVIYTAVLPMNVMSYDERSKWDRLTLALPYGRTTLGVSRYVFALLCLFSVTPLILVSAAISRVISSAVPNFMNYLSMYSIAMIYQAIAFPFMFRLGLEKGRLVYVMGMAMVVAVTMTGMQSSGAGTLGMIVGEYGILMFACAVVLFVLSMFVSISLFKKRVF